ncbi:type II secretion system F family protein [Kitasatospora sp. NBC_00070]|uniref:type II secretion system F family protein n=1 Tax=Kitasatospora sp. NBC_00070 TaxID=2975962 RepID=UPI00324FFAF7
MLLFVLCGLSVAGGLVALVAGVYGKEPVAAEPGAWSDRLTPSARRRLSVQAALAVLGSCWLILSGRPPVSIGLLALLVFGLPWVIGATRADMHRIDRLEALAEWTQRLGDVLLLGVGLNQAIVTSRRTAPPALEAEIAELSARLQSRWRPEEALRAFADTLGDATSDKVLAALVLRAGDTGPGLARTLADLATSVREEVRQRRVIEADRAKHRTTIRWLLMIIMLVLVVGFFNERYSQPYATLVGQLVLGVVLLLFVLVIAWMRKLATSRPLPRLLEPDRRSKARPVPTAAAEDAAPGTGRNAPSVGPFVKEGT